MRLSDRFGASLSCPWCGANTDSAPRAHGCWKCEAQFVRDGGVLSWRGDVADLIPSRGLWSQALHQLNPLSSRLSPLRYIGNWRVNRYYDRTLSDAVLAQNWARRNLRELHLPRGAAVLDHGCGRGRHIELLSQLGFIVGAQEVVAHPWWHRLPECFIQKVPASAPRLPWKDATFAMVLDFLVLQNLPLERLSALASEVLRVLAPGGYWLIAEANDESYGAATMRRIIGRLHPVTTVREIAARAGFVEIDLTYEGFYAPMFPRAVDFVRKTMHPGAFDVDDYRSTLAARIPASRRKMWLLRLRKCPGATQ